MVGLLKDPPTSGIRESAHGGGWKRINEDESVLVWWMAKFRNILNLRFIFCKLEANNAHDQALKVNMKAWLRGKLVLVCDMVYRSLIDHNPSDVQMRLRRRKS
jgi:hypothetical protein